MKENKTKNELMLLSKLNIFQKISSSSIIAIVAFIMATIGILAIGITVYFDIVINFAGEDCHFKFDSILFNSICSAFALVLLYFLIKYILPKINEYVLLILVMIFALCLGTWWINYIKFRPVADQSLIIYCAEALLDDRLTSILEPGEYLNRNPHQMGCIAYIMTAFTLLRTRDPLVLQNLNILYSIACAIVLYFIVREIFKEKMVRKISILLIGFFSIYWTFFSTHVYGNIPGLMFALLAILFTIRYLKNNKIYNFFIIGLSITIAYLLKSNFQIFLIAILIILGLHAIQNKKTASIFGAIGIFIFVFAFKSVIYTYFEQSTGYSLDTGVAMSAYVYMGIAEPVTLSPGWYTADVERIYEKANFDKAESNKIATKLLIDRAQFLLSDWSYTFSYFSQKLQTTWLNPTFQVFWCSTPSTLLNLDPAYNNRIAPEKLLISILTGTAYKIEERILDVFQIVTFLTASYGLYLSIKGNDLTKTLLPLVFLGGFIFHIIWETKAIYVIQYFYIMLPFSAYGIYELYQFINAKLRKIDKELEIHPNMGKIIEFKRNKNLNC